MDKMFCFQCEQTAGGKACTGRAGVCGKTAEVATAQDRLTGALIALAKTAGKSSGFVNETTDRLIIDGLFTTVTNVSFDAKSIEALIDRVHAENERLAKEGGVDATADFNMKGIWEDSETVRSLKSLILFGLRGTAAYASHARVLGKSDAEVNAFFRAALEMLSMPGSMMSLLPLALKVGEVNLFVMEMLNDANTSAFGTPEPTEVTYTVERGPFIIVTGHDLLDLSQLLEQASARGVNVYTHGEMLPAHAYPQLKKFANLKGNFGTAWHNQQKEFDGIPAPILFTTNCLMPPKKSYADRVFTTGEVQFPETPHIEAVDGKKDFTAVIDAAIDLGGWEQDQHFTGLNGGTSVTTGFAKDAVVSIAPTVVEAVKSGAIKHFFLVGGCDGARNERDYYTEFVKQAPKDSVILTLACGKYRFNDLDLGTINGIPRILDVGQCNDAFSAIQIAIALADAFECGLNELPLTMILSWYEQKAVCILLTLLHLGIRNIHLGPTIPAFLAPNVLNFMRQVYGVKPTTTPEQDLAQILGA